MKIVSAYMRDKEFDVVTNSIEENGQHLNLISHASLEDVLLYQVPAQAPEKLPITYDYEIVKAELNHAVAICTITDADGRRISAVGEAVEETLINDIAKSIPVTMASNRAFDRAVIRYMTFPGRYYSDQEIQTNKSQDKDEIAKEKAKQTISEAVVEEPIEIPVSAPVNTEPEPSSKELTLEEAKMVICTSGAAKGKSMELAMKDNPKIVQFIADGKMKKCPEKEIKAAKLLVASQA